MHTTTDKWCSSWGANYYQTIVRRNGYPNYVFDAEGRDAIKSICRSNDSEDFSGVDEDIHNAAVLRGEGYRDRMEVLKEREAQRMNLKIVPSKNVNAVREYDKMYDIPGSQDIDRQIFSERHAQYLNELDTYESSAIHDA